MEASYGNLGALQSAVHCAEEGYHHRCRAHGELLL